MKEKNDNFIMLPTVDFCFKELMNNPKVRKGFISALLHVSPEDIGSTTLLPTELRRNSEDDKLGILDVRVEMTDGTQMDLEMQVEYFEYWDERVIFYISKMFTEQIKKGEPYENLKKCIHVSILDFIHFPEDEECYRVVHLCDERTGKRYSDKLEIQILELKKLRRLSQLKEMGNPVEDEAITAWMQFFSGKQRKEFEAMAKTDEYLEEAYSTLLHLSEDEQKRLEYEAREKALRDYNSQMNSALRRGEKQGEIRGELRGEIRGELRGIEKGKRELLTSQVGKLLSRGWTAAEISETLDEPLEKIGDIISGLNYIKKF